MSIDKAKEIELIRMRELEEKDRQTHDEIHKFSKVIERCLEISARSEAKQTRQKRIAAFSKPPAPEPPSKRQLILQRKLQKQNMVKQRKAQKELEILAKREASKLRRE